MKQAARVEAGLQRLLSRIGLGWRLAIAMAVLIAPLGALGFWYVQSKIEAIELARTEKIGFGYIERLEHLVRHVADRHGLIVLQRAGDGDAPAKIRQLTQQMDRDIAQLEAQGGFADGLAEAGEQFDAIKGDVTRIKSETRAVLPGEIDRRHAALLAHVIDLSHLVAEQMLIIDSRPETSYLISTFFIHGVERTQVISRIRDVLVAATSTPPDEALHLKMTAEIARIRDLDRALERSLAKAYRFTPELESRMGAAPRATEEKLARLVRHAETFARGEPLALDAAQRFAAGAQVLDSYAELDEIADQLFTEKIERIIDQTVREELTAIGLVLAAILAGLLTAVLSVRSVTGPVGRLIRVVGLLAKGHKETRSELDTADEIGVLGRAFDKLMDERGISEEKLAYLAQYDALTGLPNRHMFHDRLNQTLGQHRGDDGRTGCMYVDLDRFKNVNDTYGHSVGDKLLIEMADRLRACVRSGDTVGRLGGRRVRGDARRSRQGRQRCRGGRKDRRSARGAVRDRRAQDLHIGQHRHRAVSR